MNLIIGWQPYPNHPTVAALVDRFATLDAQCAAEASHGNREMAMRILAEMAEVRKQLTEVSQALLRDSTLVPQWSECTIEDEETDAIPCGECGNKVAAGETVCTYCGWTYEGEAPGDWVAGAKL